MGITRSILSISPRYLSLAYFLLGLLWFGIISLGIAFGTQVSTTVLVIVAVAGLGFVTGSSISFYLLSRVHHQQIEITKSHLETINQQLQVLHRVFRHNIRNELNVIMGYATVACENVRESKTETKNYLNRVEETAADIVNISEKLKIIDMVGPIVESSGSLDLVGLVKSEIRQLETANPSISVNMHAPDVVWISADDSFRFAVREVFENAVRHADGHTDHCRIAIRITRQETQYILEIADNGPGIPQEELVALQSQEETPLVHASSVGLWLVTWLTDMQGGSVTFRSGSPSGTTATFTLPAAEPSPSARSESVVSGGVRMING